MRIGVLTFPGSLDDVDAARAVRLAGGVPVDVVTTEDQGYRVSVEQLEAARTPRTKALLWCSPSNPTGAVASPEEVEAVGRWAVEHGVWLRPFRNLIYTMPPYITSDEDLRRITEAMVACASS